MKHKNVSSTSISIKSKYGLEIGQTWIYKPVKVKNPFEKPDLETFVILDIQMSNNVEFVQYKGIDPNYILAFSWIGSSRSEDFINTRCLISK